MRAGLVRIVAIQFSLALKASWWTIVAGICLGASTSLVLLALVPLRYESTTPAAPLRGPLIALGILTGCLIFVGPLLTRRFLNPTISCKEGLVSLSGVPLLARIPRIPTPGTTRERAGYWIKNLALSLLSVVALVAALVTLG